MAALETISALSRTEAVSESIRERELYRYYQPDPQTEGCQPLPQLACLGTVAHATAPSSKHATRTGRGFARKCSPDTALTAFTQLVAWKTGADRALISLVDDSNQYFLAESTKSVDLLNPEMHAPGDDLWLGCGASAKSGGLCEQTIKVAPTEFGKYPAFIVPDLSKDPRYSDAPFVKGPPHLRFHAGVPLITKRGIPIGSLFIIDSQPRSGLTDEQIHFMGTMAGTIMRHLEMVREVEEHRMGMKMSRGLASFVEGRSELVEAEVDNEDGEGSRIAGNFEIDQPLARSKSRSGSVRSSVTESVSGIEHKDQEKLEVLSRAVESPLGTNQELHYPGLVSSSVPNSFVSTSHSQSTPPVDLLDKSPETNSASEESSIKVLFSRAANLIREAFEVNGGAVFFDAQKGFRSESQVDMPSNSRSSQDTSQTSDDDQYPTNSASRTRLHRRSRSSSSESLGLGDGAFSRSSADAGRSVEILGFSTANASSINNDSYPGPSSFIPFDENSLQTLLRRYPRGKLWIFDHNGCVSSASDDDASKVKRQPAMEKKEVQRRQRRHLRNLSDGKFLLKHFPDVRQLLFIPLWDAGRARWLGGCCVWSTERTRIFTRQKELSFLSAFGNSVMAECYRIDTEVANQKKGDFIGSISHELRSPLHGILASAEFLGEEVLTSFEKGLVETIDSCGRTLLDTINHILDFSKINHFEKTWKRNRNYRSRLMPHSTNNALVLRQADIPMINLFADVDVSIVCEEVVEGVFAGHVFQNVTAQSFDMVPGSHGKMSDARKSSSDSTLNSGSEFNEASQVSVILDVDYDSYAFTTQPGAFRRVIMNLLGNALKYTSHGYVRITLESTPMPDLPNCGPEHISRSMVVLTVTDTGKGISSEFLRSKLFTPFAQENSLSSGTGLGLSIVRSIVALLEGEVTFDSEVGRGTQVKVSLPLLREIPRGTDATIGTPRSVTSTPREIDETIFLLRARIAGQCVSLDGFDIDTVDPIVRKMGQHLKASVSKYLKSWYGLRVVPLGQDVSIVIANEANHAAITRIFNKTSGLRSDPCILVLCSHASRFDRFYSRTGTSKRASVGYIAKPVGPLKLAKAIRQCLEGASSQKSSESSAPPLGSHQSSSGDLSSIFEEISSIPNHREVLDNSRMAADSDNARKAIEPPTPNAVTEKSQEFPFNISAVESSAPTTTSPPRSSSEHCSLNVPIREDNRQRLSPKNSAISPPRPISSNLEPTTTSRAHSPPRPNGSSPTLLLVDDNKINLRLLRTYMQKRKYAVVHEAENGLEAVKKVYDREEGYDIIFMDISMPVLDGFGATRQIRAIEEGRRQRRSSEMTEGDASVGTGAAMDIPMSPQSKNSFDGTSATNSGNGDAFGLGEPEIDRHEKAEGALVIAFTGLASSSDQSEAFTSGIDLFLTKPVSFREVGKLLDNWEANWKKEVGKKVL